MSSNKPDNSFLRKASYVFPVKLCSNTKGPINLLPSIPHHTFKENLLRKWVTHVTLFSGKYLRNHWTLDIGVLGYIGIVWPKEHSPEVRSFPPGTPCVYIYIYLFIYRHFDVLIASHTGLLFTFCYVVEIGFTFFCLWSPVFGYWYADNTSMSASAIL